MTAPGLDLFPIGLVVRELTVGEQGKVLVEYSFALLVTELALLIGLMYVEAPDPAESEHKSAYVPYAGRCGCGCGCRCGCGCMCRSQIMCKCECMCE